jgi:hypothetical protein
MTEAPKLKRRWFQYSLRTLLLPMLLASIGISWVGVKIQQGMRERQVAASVEKVGGKVYWDMQPSMPGFLRSVLGVAMKRVHGVDLHNTQVTDAVLEQLKGLSQLQGLCLSYTQVTDTGLAHLKGLNQLKQLHLGFSQVSDEGVKKLQHALPNCVIDHCN